MNYSKPELIEALAQRYVLGTMGSRARRRFADILHLSPLARERVQAWEERLQPLLLSLDPVQPSELVWQRIAREISPAVDSKAEASLQKKWGFLNVAAVAMLALTISITSLGWWQAANQPAETIIETVVVTQPEAAAVSVLANAEGSFWVTRIYPKSARLDVEVQSIATAQPDKDFELWTIQDDGKPVSLGLLPKSGRKTIQLDSLALAAISRSQLLAVSLEPLGGSPEAVPTGPVLYSGALFMPQG